MAKHRSPLKAVEGYRTYISAFVLVILSGLYMQGYIDEDTYRALEGIVLGGAVTFLRMGMKGGGK